MKLFQMAIGVGIASWAIASAMKQRAHAHRRDAAKEVTRWEGEGGAIPEVETEGANAIYTGSQATERGSAV
jgi:hypothetical protein